MKHAVATLALLALLASSARAAVTFEYLFDNGYPVSVSADGSVVVGNGIPGFVPFRWTQATGFVSLGRAQYGGGGGTSSVSWDGTKVAASIGAVDSSYNTQGLWTLGGGWQELMPPAPPDGGVLDNSYGSVWAISGDGSTVVGLYDRPGQGNRAHASKWTQADGVTDLGGTTTGQASRANAVNYDGSVIGGWVETPQGPWRPALWYGGACLLLTNYDSSNTVGIGEVRAISGNGDFVAGFARNAPSEPRGLVKWARVGGVYGPLQPLGWVEGTEETGLNVPYGVTQDGQTIVGYCTFDGSPFGTTGFIWTPGTGVVDVNLWLANNGVLVDPNFTITGLAAITPDGTQIFGSGQMLTPPYTRRAFRITVPHNVSVSEPAALSALMFSPPRPNPSSASTHLEFSLPTTGQVDLSIYDASGRRVATLIHEPLPAGPRTVAWDGRGARGHMVTSGLYFARLVTPAGSVTRRLVREN